MKIAIFGSAFDPPTRGHADAIDYVLEYEFPIEKVRFDKVLLIPSFVHAFAKKMTDYPLRVAMLQEFVKDLRKAEIAEFPIEHLVAEAKTPIYTYDLLDYLQSQHFPSDELTFVMGVDNQQNWHKFYNADQIKERWNLLVVPERKHIRSTMVRELKHDGHPVGELVTPGVNKFIEENGLYVR